MTDQTDTRLILRVNHSEDSPYADLTALATAPNEDGIYERLFGVEANIFVSQRHDGRASAQVGHPTGGDHTTEGVRLRGRLILALCDLADHLDGWFEHGVTVAQAIEALALVPVPGTDPWFSETASERRKARAICNGCPVRQPCAELGASQQYGIWGGLTPNQRSRNRV